MKHWGYWYISIGNFIVQKKIGAVVSVFTVLCSLQMHTIEKKPGSEVEVDS